MNENSLLCRLISSCPDWQRVVASKHINYKSEGPYTIFNYDTLNCDFFDSVVQEARGIIIDVPRLEVVCWPFRKFGNYSESYADEIDWSSARVQTKIDGSIVKLWWSKRDGEWVWSTNSCIYAEDASAFDNLTFYDVIRKALDRSPICFDRLNKNHTYMFELVSPDTQVVIYYPAADLWHIGTRDNVSGQELIEDIGIHRPKEYPLRSLSQCIEAANKLNYGLDDVRKEGFVVVDKNWHRIKVKSPEYFVAHKLDTAKPETRYHGESLGKHMLMVRDYLDQHYPDADATLRSAAILHDIGKFDTLTIVDSEAHYYNHEHVGAYKSLFVKDLPKQEDRLHRALLIELHMRPISYEQNSALQTKDRQLYGDKIIDGILILHDADIHGRKELQ